jgi:hypothetical protein
VDGLVVHAGQAHCGRRGPSPRSPPGRCPRWRR